MEQSQERTQWRGIITNSMRTCFLDCPYKFFNEYIRRLTPIKEPDYFRWGSLIHLCAEYRDKGLDIDQGIEEFRTQIEEQPHTERVLQETEEMCTLVPRVMDAHFLKWHEEDKFFEHLGVETCFSYTLPCGWQFKGKIDKPFRDTRTGEVYLLERKTAASIGERYWSDLALDSQPKGYLLAAQKALGLQVTKVIYDVFGKPQLRQRKDETRAEFIQRLGDTYLYNHEKLFERRIVTFTQQEIEEYEQDIDAVARSIEWHMENALWPKHHPKNRFGACPFLPLCTRGDESGYYVREKDQLNPEL